MTSLLLHLQAVGPPKIRPLPPLIRHCSRDSTDVPSGSDLNTEPKHLPPDGTELSPSPFSGIPALLGQRDHQISERVDLERLSRHYQRRGARLFDHGRSARAKTGLDPAAPVNGSMHALAIDIDATLRAVSGI